MPRPMHIRYCRANNTKIDIENKNHIVSSKKRRIPSNYSKSSGIRYIRFPSARCALAARTIFRISDSVAEFYTRRMRVRVLPRKTNRECTYACYARRRVRMVSCALVSLGFDEQSLWRDYSNSCRII